MSTSSTPATARAASIPVHAPVDAARGIGIIITPDAHALASQPRRTPPRRTAGAAPRRIVDPSGPANRSARAQSPPIGRAATSSTNTPDGSPGTRRGSARGEPEARAAAATPADDALLLGERRRDGVT